jgi:hypothetical protein
MPKNEHISASPLHWPEGWRRTAADQRTRARFNRKEKHYGEYGSWNQTRDLSVSDALSRVMAELITMGIDRDDLVISTNLDLRLDGLPRSNQRAPDDPGAAVYWMNGKERRCMAIDRYDRVQDNLAAIAATLSAMRAIARHGGAEILDRAFTGFVALPSPAQWWHVLGFETAKGLSAADIERRYKELAMQRHPDRGGDNDAMAELNWARESGLEAITV